MILVKNKWFPFGNYKAINICGIVFYKGDNLSDKTINHEKIHTKQMIELLFIFFYLWYGIEYLIIRLFHKKQNIELYKEWFGEDNIENIKDKIIESAIVNWFEDEDAGIEKVWNYFRAI